MRRVAIIDLMGMEVPYSETCGKGEMISRALDSSSHPSRLLQTSVGNRWDEIVLEAGGPQNIYGGSEQIACGLNQ